MTANSLDNVFSPIQVGPVEVPNRLFQSPHGILHNVPDPAYPGFALPSGAATSYYVARAKGGVGLIVQGGTQVHPSSKYPANETWHLFSDEAVAAFTPLVQSVHDHGAKVFVQLWHAGLHGDHYGQYGGPMSASAVQPAESPALPVRAMTKDDIREIQAAFVQCTENANRAGYDGVELHSTHTYLPEQFLSPFFNKRTDEYGGSLENRMRFIVETLEAMRTVSDGMAVGIRFICDERLPGGLTVEDCSEIAALLDESQLLDFFNLDIGTYHEFDTIIAPWPIPEHFQMEPITAVSRVISRAVRMGVPTRFHDPAVAERWIAEGVLDMVGGARGFLADPELAIKAKTGRSAEIRPCIGMMTCLTPAGCAVNASSGLGMEMQWRDGDVAKAADQKRIVVIGAGPGGLEAARVAALRGHHVQLIDNQDRLGGTLNLVAAIPGRDNVLEAVEWWGRELERLKVDVNLKTEATAAMVEAEHPDIVLIATGARFDTTGSTGFRPELPGASTGNLLSPEQVLEDESPLSGTYVVLDEEAVTSGVGVAEALAARGASVEIVTRWAQLGQFLTYEYPLWYRHIRRRLDAQGVRVSPHSYVEKVEGDRVTVFDVDTGAKREVGDVRGVVAVTFRRPVAQLAADLTGSTAAVHLIGDAMAPRNMAGAVRHSWDLVQRL